MFTLRIFRAGQYIGYAMVRADGAEHVFRAARAS